MKGIARRAFRFCFPLRCSPRTKQQVPPLCPDDNPRDTPVWKKFVPRSRPSQQADKSISGSLSLRSAIPFSLTQSFQLDNLYVHSLSIGNERSLTIRPGDGAAFKSRSKNAGAFPNWASARAVTPMLSRFCA